MTLNLAARYYRYPTLTGRQRRHARD